MKISASVYSSKDKPLKELIADLDQHGIDYFHIDCNDDERVFDDIAAIRRYSSTPIDLHLITPHPDRYFDRINALGIELVTLQYEELNGYQYKGGLNAKMGLSLVSGTDLKAFADQSTHFDFVLMMATTPGQSGGRFDKINFRKIRAFKNQFPQKAIHVDGGVNAEVSFILRNMGVDASVVGSYLFKNLPIGAALLNLKLHDIESHYLVGDFMRLREESPIIGPENRNLASVLQSIEDHRLGFTILEDQAQRLEGIISNADLRRAMLRHVHDLSRVELEPMINRSPVTIREDTTVSDMLLFIKEFEFPINYLPVLDETGHVMGVVSFLNLVKGEL
jgi:ribulose-phosphate 3-epimerase